MEIILLIYLIEMEGYLLVIFGILSLLVVVMSDVITSPPVNNWGRWADDFEFCPEGTFTHGFQLKSESWIGPFFDDSSLNGIRLFCGNPSEDGTATITSTVGSWGKWKNTYRCSEGGYINGFQLRSEKGSLIDYDETAANNLRIFCTQDPLHIEGDGETHGKWSAVQKCRGDKVVCGIKTQVQSDRGNFLDDTALNNVAMKCCDLSAPDKN